MIVEKWCIFGFNKGEFRYLSYNTFEEAVETFSKLNNENCRRCEDVTIKVYTGEIKFNGTVDVPEELEDIKDIVITEMNRDGSYRFYLVLDYTAYMQKAFINTDY